MAASYITGQDNPWFAKAYINRIWYVLMGEAFYEPIDDIGPERTPRAPRFLNPLADAVAARRLRHPLAVPDDPEHPGLPAASSLDRQRGRQDARSLRAAPAGSAPTRSSTPWSRPWHSRWTRTATSFTPRQSQAGRGPAGAPGPAAQAVEPGRSQAALSRQGVANKGRGQESSRGHRAGLAGRQEGRRRLAPGGPRLLFDRLFGVDPSVANEDVMGTIPQALFLMNSPMVNNRTQARPGTVLGEILSTAPNDRAALDALYVRVLSRQPTTRKSRSAAAT